MTKSDTVRGCKHSMDYMVANGFDCRASMELLSEIELAHLRNLLGKIYANMGSIEPIRETVSSNEIENKGA